MEDWGSRELGRTWGAGGRERQTDKVGVGGAETETVRDRDRETHRERRDSVAGGEVFRGLHL